MNDKLTKATILKHIDRISVESSIIKDTDEDVYFHFRNEKAIIPVHLRINDKNKDKTGYISIRFVNLCNDENDTEFDTKFRSIKANLICNLQKSLLTDSLYVDEMRWGWREQSLHSIYIKQYNVRARTTRELVDECKTIRREVISSIWSKLEYHHEDNACHDICGYETIRIDWDEDELQFIKKGYTYKSNDISLDELCGIFKELTKETYYKVDDDEYDELFEAHQALQAKSMEFTPVGEAHTLTWKDGLTLVIDEGKDNEKTLTIEKIYR